MGVADRFAVALEVLVHEQHIGQPGQHQPRPRRIRRDEIEPGAAA